MGLEIELNHDSVNKLEKFIATSKYKELPQNTMSFNRKLNEERKMRIPYVDSQVRDFFLSFTPGIFNTFL